MSPAERQEAPKRGPLNRRSTLADVAERAGVSISTASRALNGRGEMASETRLAVLESAAELKFRPSVLARSLRTSQTFTIGFVAPDVSAPFYAAALRGSQAVLERAGYRVMLMNTERNVATEVDALHTLLNHHVDGLLIATTGLAPEDFADVVGNAVPSVFFDGILEGVGTGSVSIQNSDGMHILVDHLVGHGHRRIALLAGSQAETSGIERLGAFKAGLAAHGLDLPQRYVRQCDWTMESGHRETLKLLARSPKPTAVVAASDDLALGCIQACRELGVSIPSDLALVSFDDPYFGAMLEPPLTALAARYREIGELAASLLVSALTDKPIVQRDIRIPVTLVCRSSCGCTQG